MENQIIFGLRFATIWRLLSNEKKKEIAQLMEMSIKEIDKIYLDIYNVN